MGLALIVFDVHEHVNAPDNVLILLHALVVDSPELFLVVLVLDAMIVFQHPLKLRMHLFDLLFVFALEVGNAFSRFR